MNSPVTRLFHLVLTQSISLPISQPVRQTPTNQLTLSLTTVRDSTVSSRLGQGTADWGTMSLSSLPSPAASGSARSLALPSAPGTRPTPAPATPGVAGGTELGGLEVLFDPPKTSLLSDAVTSSPLPSALAPSALTSRLGSRLPRLGRVVLRSWGCSLWFCWVGTRLVLGRLGDGRWGERCCTWGRVS